jgi:hypothetical protein
MATNDELERAPEPGEVERARSTPLRPVVWMTGVLVWATVVALIVRIPTWASVFLCTVTGISFLVFLVGYIYLFMSDRDALRAERWRRGAGGATSRGVSGHQPQALGAERREYLGPEHAEALAARTEAGERRGRLGDAGGRTTE